MIVDNFVDYVKINVKSGSDIDDNKPKNSVKS